MENSQVCAGLEITELRLGLPGSDSIETNPIVGKKRSFGDTCDGHGAEDAGSSTRDGNDSNQPPVVGWPPIRSYRKNHLKKAKADEKETRSEVGLYVKVAMDGAPFLRKIQLKAYKGYSDLSRVLPTMFSNLSPLGNGCANSEYIAIYEDKDHDWMLVGDVPWEMFVQSCKRLRIMRRTEVIDVGTGHKDAR